MGMVSDLTRRQAFLVLNALPNIGPITLNRLLDLFDGNPVAVFSADVERLKNARGVGDVIANTLRHWRDYVDLEKEERLIAQAGVDFLTWDNPAYPNLLREIHDPPIGLYCKGEYRFDRPAVAIVGTRRATLYGQSVARSISRDLARCGFCVVSGLARGIDTAAHNGAIEGEGRTLAVLGCGLDIIYPPENLDLYRKIAESGAILSEFPFGRKVDRQSFPMRNRIISGICQAVVVVESDINGGSIITAKFAGDQGRTVLAVPGRIDQAAARGCNQLIRDGAILCMGVDDILDELNYLDGMRPPPAGDKCAAENALPEIDLDEKTVLQCLSNGEALDMDRIAERTGKAPHELMPLLMMMELKRLVVKRINGLYEARQGG